MMPLVPRDAAAAYALGALGPAEQEAFERLARRDAEVARDVAAYREVTALLAYAAPPAPPPAFLRDRVLATVG